VGQLIFDLHKLSRRAVGSVPSDQVVGSVLNVQGRFRSKTIDAKIGTLEDFLWIHHSKGECKVIPSLILQGQLHDIVPFYQHPKIRCQRLVDVVASHRQGKDETFLFTRGNEHDYIFCCNYFRS